MMNAKQTFLSKNEEVINNVSNVSNVNNVSNVDVGIKTSHTSQTQTQTQAKAKSCDISSNLTSSNTVTSNNNDIPLNYGVLYYQARIELDITVFEYLVCEIVYQRHTYMYNKSGWCEDNKQTIANTLGISRRYVIKMIKRLIDHGLLEKNETGRLLRTTPLWQNTRKRHASKKKDKPENGELQQRQRQQSENNVPTNERVNFVHHNERVNFVHHNANERVNFVHHNGEQSSPKGETKIGEHASKNGESEPNTAFFARPTRNTNPSNNYKKKKKKGDSSSSDLSGDICTGEHSVSKSPSKSVNTYDTTSVDESEVLSHLVENWNACMPQLGFQSAPPAHRLPKTKLKEWLSEIGDTQTVLEELETVIIPFLKSATENKEWPIKSDVDIPTVGVDFALNSPQLRKMARRWVHTQLKYEEHFPALQKVIDLVKMNQHAIKVPDTVDAVDGVLTESEKNFVLGELARVGYDKFREQFVRILQYLRLDHTDKTEDAKRLVDLRFVLNKRMWNDNLTTINRDKYFLEWVRVEKAKARATANKESEERKQQRRIDEIIKNRADDIRYITKKIIPVYEQCGIDIDIDIDTDTDTDSVFDLSILPKKYVRWVATKLDAVSGYKHFEQGKDVQFILDSLTDIVTDMLSDERVRNKGGILSWELKNVGMWEKSYISKQ